MRAGLNAEYNDEIMSFLASQGNVEGNMEDNNFQNLSGGPDPSSVMFDGFSKNHNNHLF